MLILLIDESAMTLLVNITYLGSQTATAVMPWQPIRCEHTLLGAALKAQYSFQQGKEVARSIA